MTPDQLHHYEVRAADCRASLAGWLATLPTAGLGPVQRAEEIVENDIPALIAEIRATWKGLGSMRTALLDLHPENPAPQHACCTPPTVCVGHPAECGSREHGPASGTPWPCRTLRAAGITSAADAAAVRAAFATLSEQELTR